MRTYLILIVVCSIVVACQQPKDSQTCTEEARNKVFSTYSFIDSLLIPSTELEASKRIDEAMRLTSDCHNNNIDSLIGKCFDKFGAYLRSWGKMGAAKNKYLQALHFYKKAHPLNNQHRNILRMYHNIALSWYEEENYFKALTYFDSAHVNTETSYPSPYIPNLIAFGFTYLELNELKIAEKYFVDAQQRINADSTGSMRGRLPFLLAYLSDCYRRQNKLQKAIQTGRKGISFIKENGWENLRRSNLATCLLNIGNAWQDSLLQIGIKTNHLKNEIRDSAILYTQQALRHYQSLNPPNVTNIGICLRNLGELYRRSSLYNQGIKILNEALQDSVFRSNPELLAELYINRGETWFDKEDFALAEKDYVQALRYLSPSWKPSIEYPIPSLDHPIINRSEFLLTLNNLAKTKIKIAKNDPAKLEFAIAVYDTLLNLINYIRGDYLSENAKMRISGESQEYLRSTFELCLTLYKLRGNDIQYLLQAFKVAEQSKALTLLETVRVNNLNRRLPEVVHKEYERIKKERSQIEGELFQVGTDSIRSSRLQEQWFDNFEALRRLRKSQSEGSNNYYTFLYSGTDFSISDVQEKLLAENQGLLEYFYQDSLLHIFLITKDTLAFMSQRIEQNFPSYINVLCSQIANRQPTREDEYQLCHIGNDVWKILVQPFKEILPKRLIIIPDYPIQTLPFEALLTKQSKGDISEQVRNQNFMLFQHEISYCFSANLLWEMTKRKTELPLKNSVAAFAPYFPKLLKLPNPLPGQMQKEELHLLKHIRNDLEVEAIKNEVSCTPFVAASATKTAFLNACKQHAAVHVSTHGILNHYEPSFNFIAFSQYDSLNTDELLKLNDLYAEKIQSELIIFSACETAVGYQAEGEGVISMTRGLVSAGAKSVVSTLFPVRPDNNADIFPEFYREIASQINSSKDSGLAKAKREFVLQSPDNHHPTNWAGIVLTGSTTPINLESKDNPSIKWYALLVLMLIMTTIYSSNKKRNG